PPEWVGICAAAGALLWNLYARTAVMKLAFNVSKESLAASAAAAMMVALGMTPVQPLSVADPFSQRALAMLGAALAYAIVDEGLSVPIVALATGTSIRHRFRSHWDVRLVSRMGAFGAALGATIVIKTDRWLLLAMPVALYMLYLLSANRVRSREERE